MSLGNIAGHQRELSSSPTMLAISSCVLMLAAALVTSLLAPGGTMLVWPAAGLAAGAIGLAPGKAARAAVAAGLAVGLAGLALASDMGALASTSFALACTAEAWLFVAAFEWASNRSAILDAVERMVIFVALAALVPGVVGLVTLDVLQLSGPAAIGIGPTWGAWWRAHGLGLLTFAPALLHFAPKGDVRRPIGAWDVAGAIAAGVLLGVIGAPIVSETSVVMLGALLIAIPLLWALFHRVDALSAALVVVTLSLVAIWANARASGLFADNAAVSAPVLALISITLLIAGIWRDETRRDQRAALKAPEGTGSGRAWFLLIPVILFTVFAWWAWRGTVREAKARVEQVVSVLSTHAQRVIEGQEGMLSAVLAGIHERAPEAIAQDPQVHALLRSLEASSATCLAMAIVRTDTARLVSTSSRFPSPDVDASQRDFIPALRAEPTATVIGSTIAAEPSGATGFTVSRTKPGSALAVVSLVDRGEFQRLYASQGASPSDYMLLFREEGGILASYPERPDPLNAKAAPLAPPMQLARASDPSPVRAFGEDGHERLYAVRKVPGYPLFVAYGLPTSFMHRAWLGHLAPFALLNLIAGLVLWQLAGRLASATRTAEAARTQAEVERALRERMRVSEAQLRQSEEASARLAAIVTTSSDGIISKTLDGTVTSWNGGAERIFGYSAAEMVGQSIRRLIPADRQHEEDAFLARLAAGERIDHYETLRIRKDGKVIDVSVNISPLRSRDGTVTGASKIIRDVSERKAAEAALTASEQRFRGIFDHAGTGIEIADFDERIAQCNPAYAAMLGYAPDELVGRHGPDLIHPDDRAANLAQLERLTTGEIASFEIVNRSLRRDGSAVWMHKHVSMLRNGDGKATHRLTLVTDMTKQRLAEERQRVLMRELAHRGKNLLAVIQSIANRSFSGQATLTEARNTFQGRMQALARTYETLTDETLDGAELETLVRGELDAFEQRARVDGPLIRLTSRSAQTLALIVHELASNAAKYGALSVATGRLDVHWKIHANGSSPRFEFIWTERGGPPAVAPERRGFGTALVSTVAGAELRCEPELVYGEEGFSYRFSTLLSLIGVSSMRSAVRERIQSRAMTALYDAWLADKGSSGGLPSFERFDRGRVDERTNLLFVEVSPSGACRIIDDGPVATAAEIDPPMSETPAEQIESVMSAYQRCAAELEPSYEHTWIDGGDGKPVSFERFMAPYLRPDGLATVVVVFVLLGDDQSTKVMGTAQD